MDGQIGVISEEGAGSIFWFKIRLAKQTDVPAVNKIRDELWGLRAIVIDDNETSNETVAAVLESWKMLTYTTTSGITALEQMREKARKGVHYDLAIVDYQMPEISGIDVAKEMRLDPILQRTKIIMLTGYPKIPENIWKDQSIASCLTKPFKSSHLYDTLVGVMSKEVVAELASATQPVSETKQIENKLRPLRILLVDDSETNREVAQLLFKKIGYTCETAHDGQQALLQLEAKVYDVVFMDIQMPVMDGYAATKAIRAGNNSVLYPQVYIIAMTANAMQGDREKCLAVGMSDYVSKPIEMRALKAAFARLGEYLDQHPTPAAPVVFPVSPEGYIMGLPHLVPPPAFILEPTPSVVKAETMTHQPPALPPAVEDDDEIYFPTHLIGLFISETQNRIDELKEALAEHDSVRMARMLHTIKGTAANFGAKELESICRQAEHHAQQANTEKVSQLLPRVEQAFVAARNQLDKNKE